MVTVAGNTIVIDIHSFFPPRRSGRLLRTDEQHGHELRTDDRTFYARHLFVRDHLPVVHSFRYSGFAAACLVKTPVKEPVKREPISLDRFVLIKGIPAGVALLLLSIPYGMTSTYIAMYAKEIGITLSSGLFFTFMAVGMAVSRMFSGRQVDKGRITQVITLGLYLVCACFFTLAACGKLMSLSPELTDVLFFMVTYHQQSALSFWKVQSFYRPDIQTQTSWKLLSKYHRKPFLHNLFPYS